MRKESLLFFSFPRRSNFDVYVKVTKKREQNKKNSFFFYPETE